mmetsp:Transcript_97405/g.275442  ORF Transcript_97405/g.275442 Transcript_97405/m.275442 type:complete len:283 (-) Transcript_97405:1736-2584(-)
MFFDSRQQESTTAWTYLWMGPGSGTEGSSSWTRVLRSSMRDGGGAGVASADTSTEAPPSASGVTKGSGSTPSSVSSCTSPELLSSAKHAFAAATRTGLPEPLSSFKCWRSWGNISAFAFGPDCTRSFHSSVALRRTEGLGSVLAMYMDERSARRWDVGIDSTVVKSCPNFTASWILSHSMKKSCIARSWASSVSKNKASCMGGSMSLGYVGPNSSTSTSTARLACFVTTSVSSWSARSKAGRHFVRCGRKRAAPRCGKNWNSASAPAFDSGVAPPLTRGNTV